MKILAELKYSVFQSLDTYAHFHPLMGIVVLQQCGINDVDILAAFAGHDIVEDVEDVSVHKRLREIIGEKSFAIVQELTYSKDLHASKAHYLKSFENKSVEAVVCKVIDRVINTQCFLHSKPDYALKYFHKADCLMEVFKNSSDKIAHVFGELTVDKINELIQSILELEK